jgi:hypothetical protein
MVRTRNKIFRLLLVGGLVALGAQWSCGEREELPVGKTTSHSHSHFHGQLRHSHPNSGVHGHEWLYDDVRYGPYRSAATPALVRNPLDVALLGARPGAFSGRSVYVQGIVTAIAEQDKHCRIELAPLDGEGGGVSVELRRGPCASLKKNVGKIATVRGTVSLVGHARLRAPQGPDQNQSSPVIDADDVQFKAVDTNLHSHGGVPHSHPYWGPHDHSGEGSLVIE